MVSINHASARRLVVKESPEEFFKKYKIPQVPAESDITPALTPPNTPSFSLRQSMTPARDQGGAGTCTSFGVISCLEFFHQRDLSEANLTDVAERVHGDCTEGLTIAHAMQTAKDTGVVDESCWMYDDTQICWANPPNTTNCPRFSFRDIATVYSRPRAQVVGIMKRALTDGISIPLASPQPSNIITAIQAVLANSRHPVIVSVPVWFNSSGLSAGWDFGPDIQMPSSTLLEHWLSVNVDNASIPGNISGWHAIAICGYDNTTGRFEFKNSWAQWWGNQGFGTIPYQYIFQYSDLGMHGWT
jgi:Papain family cysteine protease